MSEVPLYGGVGRDRSQFKHNNFTEMCSSSEAGSYLRLIDFVYQLNSRLESNHEEEEEGRDRRGSQGAWPRSWARVWGLGFGVGGKPCDQPELDSRVYFTSEQPEVREQRARDPAPAMAPDRAGSGHGQTQPARQTDPARSSQPAPTSQRQPEPSQHQSTTAPCSVKTPSCGIQKYSQKDSASRGGTGEVPDPGRQVLVQHERPSCPWQHREMRSGKDRAATGKSVLVLERGRGTSVQHHLRRFRQAEGGVGQCRGRIRTEISSASWMTSMSDPPLPPACSSAAGAVLRPTPPQA